MKITKHDTFVDVCCDAPDMSETKIIDWIRQCLNERDIAVTDEPPGRVGNAGIGTIFRFNYKQET